MARGFGNMGLTYKGRKHLGVFVQIFFISLRENFGILDIVDFFFFNG